MAKKKQHKEIDINKVKELSEEYGELYKLKVSYEKEKDLTAYFRKPNIKELEYFNDNYFNRIDITEINIDFDPELPINGSNPEYIISSKPSTKHMSRALRHLWNECYVYGDVEFESEDYDDIVEIHKQKMLELLDYHDCELVEVKYVPKKYRTDNKNIFYVKLTKDDKDYFAGFKRLNAGMADIMYDLHDRKKYFASDRMLAEKGFVIGDPEMVDFTNYPSFFTSYRRFLGSMIRRWSAEFQKKS